MLRGTSDIRTVQGGRIYGYGRLEKILFEAYNESAWLIESVEHYKKRTGYYPERVLADQIYRTREKQEIL